MLLQEIRDAFEREALDSSKKRLLLTAALPAHCDLLKRFYELSKLSRYLDWINLMAYDMHGVWAKCTGPQSPLDHYDPCIVSVIQLLLSSGLQPHQLVIGLPSYAKTFQLISEEQQPVGFGAPTKGHGAPGPITQAAGTLASYELDRTSSEKPHTINDALTCTGYMNANTLWATFDTAQSAARKANYVVDNKLGGMMMWSLDLDDFIHNYPLLSSISNILLSHSLQ